MGENSAIGWTDNTFNPWWGCTKVSDGCKNCYAETLSTRFGKNNWGPKGSRERKSVNAWNAPIVWNDQAAKSGTRIRVFCASMSDVFEDRAELRPWRLDLFDLIRKTPNLDWQLLTKRPENVMHMLADIRRDLPFEDWRQSYDEWLILWRNGEPPKNVWIGTSVENQAMADKRIPELLCIPAVVRFLSVEPMLGPVDLAIMPDIDWIICGGESGPGARPMEIEWARSLKDQASRWSIPFFMKQLGGVKDKRHNLSDFPEDLRVQEFPIVEHNQ